MARHPLKIQAFNQKLNMQFDVPISRVCEERLRKRCWREIGSTL
jgi:hypothetical protein